MFCYAVLNLLKNLCVTDITCSTSVKSCDSDNSAMGGFFSRMKNEMFYGRDWGGITIEGFAMGGTSAMGHGKRLGFVAWGSGTE